jgi:GAF domain-containing protein/HAMP domain-containing protein
MNHRIPSSAEERQTRNAYIITWSLMLATVPTSALFFYFGYINNIPKLYISAIAFLATTFFDIYPLSLIRRGRKNLAMMLVMTAFTLNVLIVPFIVQGLGLIIALSIVLVLLSIAGLTLPQGYSTAGLVVAVVSGALAVILDGALGIERVRVPELENYTPIILGGIAIPILYVFTREFNRFSLQAKITLGILLTGGITVATLVMYGANRANFIGNFITDRYEKSVVERNETNISNALKNEAHGIDDVFARIQDDITDIAEFRSGLEKQNLLTTQGGWNAVEKLILLPEGQYGNSAADPASVYIPNSYSLSNQMVLDLNKTIQLDLIAPTMLEAHPEIVAIYYISKLGYTIYYPNIRLAENVPSDFDPTTQPFYTIATPENNPERLPRWTNPYQDPAGAGMIITLSIPVYNGSEFVGVASADIRISEISQIVSNIKLSESGISLLVDNSGLVVALTDKGYQYFGLEPETLQVNETPKQSILDSPFLDVQEIAKQVLSTDSGISKIEVDGIDTYLSVTTLESTGYKLAFIAPVSELESEIVAVRADIDKEITNTIQEVSLILVILLVGGFIASLVVGQIITRPLKRLTETVEQIAAGNLSSRASIESGDESGLLAQSFNAMADQLTETLQGLEDRISERTKEMEVLNQNSIHRASLFESVALISRIISSTRSIDQLLPQITETISSQLGYYHVGIFLVDVHNAYAVLVAANSEGGKRMLASNYSLKVGGAGVVGYVTQSGSPRIAADGNDGIAFVENSDLPETRSEIALPLRSGSEIIGALDVQSKSTNAFTEEDVNILSALADQVSIAIQNARSFQQSLEALQQAQRTAAQLSEQQWSQFQKQQTQTGYHFDGVNAHQGKPKQQASPNKLTIPIILRGVQIGSLNLSASDPDRKWDNNEIAMAQATAERTALAIETARLLQDAQKRASKERAIGQISAKIGSLVNIDNIVQTTIQELGETLSGTDVAIQFTSGQSRQDA